MAKKEKKSKPVFMPLHTNAPTHRPNENNDSFIGENEVNYTHLNQEDEKLSERTFNRLHLFVDRNSRFAKCLPINQSIAF